MSKTLTARRNFLKSSIASLAGGVVLVNSEKLFATEDQQQLNPEKISSTQGYRETEHIQKYYRHARF